MTTVNCQVQVGGTSGEKEGEWSHENMVWFGSMIVCQVPSLLFAELTRDLLQYM